MTDTPRDWADEKALELLESRTLGDGMGDGHWCDEMARELRAARRVPEGYVREGVTDRKVLGTLPVTADGCVIGEGCKVFDLQSYGINETDEIGLAYGDAYDAGFIDTRTCYSTRAAAAEAARERL